MYGLDDAAEQVARHMAALRPDQIAAVIGRFVMNAAYHAGSALPQEDAHPAGSDHVFHNNADVWQAILDRQLTYGSRVILESFFLFEWLPQSPGLYFTDEGRQSRQLAAQFIESNVNGVITYSPDGKASMLDGGVGNLRLLPLNDQFIVLSASSTGVCHQGLPVALPLSLYDVWIDEIKRKGAAVRTLVGRLKYIPKELTELYSGYSRVPRLYLQVEDTSSPARPATRPMDGLKVSVAVSFVSDFEGQDKSYACYVNFDPSSDQSFRDNLHWMEDDYVVGRYKGRIITNFDEHETCFAQADISVKKVMSLTLTEQDIARAGQAVHVDTAYIRQAILAQNEIQEVYMDSKYKVNIAGGQGVQVGDNNRQTNTFGASSEPQ